MSTPLYGNFIYQVHWGLTLEFCFLISKSHSDSAEFAGTILMLKLFENRFINTMNTLAASVEDIKATRSPCPLDPQVHVEVGAIDGAGAVSGSHLRAPVSSLRAAAQADAGAGRETDPCVLASIKVPLSPPLPLSLSPSLPLSLSLSLSSYSPINSMTTYLYC